MGAGASMTRIYTLSITHNRSILGDMGQFEQGDA